MSNKKNKIFLNKARLLVLAAVLFLIAAGSIFLNDEGNYVKYSFRSEKLLVEHYEKHGKDMGFDSAEEYEQAASDVINNPEALNKEEAEDGDGVYYLMDTNEIVFLSKDGYIRSYFCPDAGADYFYRQ